MTAAEDIYHAYYDKVSAYINGKVDNHHDAEDLTAQVFEKVYSKLRTFDETKASLSTWIYTITRNTVTDYYRTRRIHASYDEAYELPAPEQDRDVLDTLADALMTLKERERDLILLHYYKGMTLKEVADKMGMSYINAKVIHKKALSGLRTYFQEDSYMENKKFEIEVDDFKHRMLVQALSEKRNELIAEGKSTEDINALLLKAIDAKPIKKKKQ